MTQDDEDQEMSNLLFRTMMDAVMGAVVIISIVFGGLILCILMEVLLGPAYLIAFMVAIVIWLAKYGPDFSAFLDDLRNFILVVAEVNRGVGLHEQWGLENVYPPEHYHWSEPAGMI